MIQVVIVIVAACAVLYFGYVIFGHKPRWKQVYDDIEELIELNGESFSYAQAYLERTYELTERQASLCLNNYPNQDWFQMQSFLEDQELN